jgi:hypothetical protein
MGLMQQILIQEMPDATPFFERRKNSAEIMKEARHEAAQFANEPTIYFFTAPGR